MAALLTPELQARVRISDDELNRVVELDHGFMADRRADWTDRWNRAVAGGSNDQECFLLRFVLCVIAYSSVQ